MQYHHKYYLLINIWVEVKVSSAIFLLTMEFPSCFGLHYLFYIIYGPVLKYCIDILPLHIKI